MHDDTFLDDEAIYKLTGYRRKSSQVAQLKRMGIPFFVSVSGHPAVPRSVVEGKKEAAPRKKWSPTWAEGRL